jgi:CubicO group peptidase (beta-lactamase class C family)
VNLFLKILAGVFVVLVLLFVGAFFYLKSNATVGVLEVNTNDTLSNKIKQADKWLAKLQEDKKFNGAVLLIKNDAVLLKSVYGFTSASQTEKLQRNSSFRLASVSKQFTAAAIMLLKQQNKLDFDDAITKFLPDLPYGNVTVRNLLNHTSGIPDIYMTFDKKYTAEIGDYLTVSKMVDLLVKENKSLESKPNSVYKYNNTGYVLLAAIIEAISNTSFEEFMQKQLFDRLEMQDTRVWNLASKSTDFENKTASFQYILGYALGFEPSILDGVAGDGSVFSSINDMVIWNQFWYNNTLIAKEIMHEAFVTPVLNDGSTSDYGFGWIITKNNAMWHSGSWLGARTMIIRNPQLKNCLVLLDNSSSNNLDKIAAQLVKVLK